MTSILLRRFFRSGTTQKSTVTAGLKDKGAILKAHPNLHKHSLEALRKIYQHPISHDLYFNETQALLVELDAVVRLNKPRDPSATSGAKAVIELNDETLTLHMTVPVGKIKGPALSEHEILETRHFLHRALQPTLMQTEKRVVVLCDGNEARVYELDNSQEKQVHMTSITASDSDSVTHRGKGHRDRPHVHHRTTVLSKDSKDFFTAIEEACIVADKVVLIGHGKGNACAAELLLSHIHDNCPHLRQKVITRATYDSAHHTEKQLLAFAEQLFDAADAESSDDDAAVGVPNMG